MHRTGSVAVKCEHVVLILNTISSVIMPVVVRIQVRVTTLTYSNSLKNQDWLKKKLVDLVEFFFGTDSELNHIFSLEFCILQYPEAKKNKHVNNIQMHSWAS